MKKREVAQRLERCELRLRRLECKHKNVEFTYDPFGHNLYIKKCKDCGAVIESFSTYKEFLESKIAFTEDSLEEMRQDLIVVQKEEKKYNGL